MDRKAFAVELHRRGFNCTQSVACAFCGAMDYDMKTVFTMAEPFGLGMGTYGTCGAVSAMAMVIGMKESDGNLDSPKSKRHCYSRMRQAVEAFKEKNQSILCRELKGIDSGRPLRSCDGCIEDAVAVLDELLLDIK